MSIFLKGSREEKLKLIYLFYDRNHDFLISKEELTSHMSGAIISMINISFEDNNIEKLKTDVVKHNETTIDAAMSIVVDEIFSKYSQSGDELTFEEW